MLTTRQAGVGEGSTDLSVPVVSLPLHNIPLRAAQWRHFVTAAFPPPNPKQRQFSRHAAKWSYVPVDEGVPWTQSERSIGGQFRAWGGGESASDVDCERKKGDEGGGSEKH